MGDSKMSLKLLIDFKNNKVLFAEAAKNSVDFLFHLLSLPLGTVIKLLRKQQPSGSLENLYDSVENLDESYIQPSQNKSIFLNPKLPSGGSTLLALKDAAEPTPKAKKFYSCSNSCSSISPFGTRRARYMSDDPRAVCPSCSQNISYEMEYISPLRPGMKEETMCDQEGGFVKGVVTYMIMDDLQVKPMSTISSIALLNKFNVTDLSALKEKPVDLGMDEALKLLKASLESKTVLTDVFLGDVRHKPNTFRF